MSYHKPYYDEDHKLIKYGLKSFLSDVFVFFRRFFSFQNIKHAFRSVITGFKEYSVFFAALLIIQSLFWLGWMNYDRYATVEYDNSRACQYNLLLEGYTNQEWVNLYNGILVVTDNQKPETRGYESYETSTYYGAPGEVLVRVKFLLTEDSEEFCQSFLKRYKLGGEHVTCTFGERTLYKTRIAEKHSVTVRNTFAIGLLSTLIVLILFMIRADNFRFRYGIYMTFGADFEKLVETAAWEMFAIAILTFVPAMFLSLLFLYLASGFIDFSLIMSRVFPCLIWTLAVIFVGVIPAVKLLSVSKPVDMIAAADSSNYVSSPRKSFHIFGKTFPWHYEIFGFIRFRKYYILLLSFAVVFTTLFSCGVYLSDMKKTETQTPKPQFEILSEYGEFDDELLDEISEVSGVRTIMFGNSLSCTAVSSFCVLDKRQASGISSKTVETKTGYADNNFKYVSMSERLCREILDHGVWKIDGDLERVVSEPYNVAVTCSINNLNCLNFEVGDTISLAKFIEMDQSVSFDKTDKKFILEKLLDGGYFEYVEVTVCAVVDDGSSDGEYRIILSDELYAEMAKRQAKVNAVSVYIDEDVDAARCEQIRDEICAIVWDVSGSHVSDKGYIYERDAALKLSEDRLLITGALFILFVSPLVWFYSQIMFGRKREKEMYIVSALGGTDSSLMRLFCVSGLVLSGLAAVATAALTSILTYMIYRFFNVFLPSLGFGENVRYVYTFSFSSFFICVGVSVVSAVVSTLIPFLIYRRDRDKRMKIENNGKRGGSQK